MRYLTKMANKECPLETLFSKSIWEKLLETEKENFDKTLANLHISLWKNSHFFDTLTRQVGPTFDKMDMYGAE